MGLKGDHVQDQDEVDGDINIDMDMDSDNAGQETQAGQFDPWNDKKEAGQASTSNSTSASTGFQDDFQPGNPVAEPADLAGSGQVQVERLPDSAEYLASLQAK